MARNGAGTFAVINPVTVGAIRSSSAVNQNFSDMGDEITNSLPLDGTVGMTGQFKAIDGVLLQPGITFDADQNLGFRRSANDEMRWSAGGFDRAILRASGKLALLGDFSLTGNLSHSSGSFGPQNLVGSGAERIDIRRTENDTSEHELASYQVGDGSGAKGSLRIVGGGSNDAQTMRFYVNDILAFQWTGSLFTHEIDTAFGSAGLRADADGFIDIPEITAPANPGSSIARLYSRDNGGATQLFYRDNSGNETPVQPPIDRQIFTASGTWNKPTSGQTQALIEVWSAGASGERRTNISTVDEGGGGGGGGAYFRKVIALASLSAAVSVTVASGGAAQNGVNTNGNDGGDSSFGAYLQTFGGKGGAFARGGGGGGLTSKGGQNTGDTKGAVGGSPLGVIGSVIWGDGGDSFSKIENNSNPFGGGPGNILNELALFGGGGGGNGNVTLGISPGGASIFGGAGGGGGAPSGTTGSGGASLLGGNGGDGATGTTPGQDGTAPGGGGGGSEDAISGAGARGEVRITAW